MHWDEANGPGNDETDNGKRGDQPMRNSLVMMGNNLFCSSVVESVSCCFILSIYKFKVTMYWKTFRYFRPLLRSCLLQN
jgi:hypothetical protein